MIETVQLITDEEGLKEIPYLDTKSLWTFGIGFCLERTPITGAMWKHLLDHKLIDVRISRAGAQYLTKQRLDVLAVAVPRLFSNWHALNDVRRSVLMSGAYQLGVDGLADFRKMRAAVEAEDWETAAKEMKNSLWFKQTPARVRRAAEAMRTGKLNQSTTTCFNLSEVSDP